jgi:hypothetical protein
LTAETPVHKIWLNPFRKRPGVATRDQSICGFFCRLVESIEAFPATYCKNYYRKRWMAWQAIEALSAVGGFVSFLLDFAPLDALEVEAASEANPRPSCKTRA